MEYNFIVGDKFATIGGDEVVIKNINNNVFEVRVYYGTETLCLFHEEKITNLNNFFDDIWTINKLISQIKTSS